MQGRATVHVDASANELYSLVTDIERMGEWSPECRGGRWVNGATGPVVGARFRGRNRRGLARWSTTPTVYVADIGREFGFVTGHRGRDMTRWTYGFDHDSSGTTVTESFEMLADMPWYFGLADRLLMGVTDRQGDLEANLAESLGRLKLIAEQRSPVR